MTAAYSDEPFTEERATYTLQVEDRFFVIENVPARESTPVRVLEAPVFQFTA